MNHRQERINDGVARTLNEAMRHVKDPRVASSFVTVNSAEVTRDLKYAKVYYGVITGSPEEVKEGLESASGFLRSSLAKELNLRITPELIFIYDDSACNAAHIAEVLKTLGTGDKKEETEE